MSLLDTFTYYFYHLVVTPIETFLSASCFITCFTIICAPSILLQHTVHTLQAVLPRTPTIHLTRNLRIRRLFTNRLCCRRRHRLKKSIQPMVPSSQPFLSFRQPSSKSLRRSSRCRRLNLQHQKCTRSKREFCRSTSIECVPPSPQLRYFDCFDDLTILTIFFSSIHFKSNLTSFQIVTTTVILSPMTTIIVTSIHLSSTSFMTFLPILQTIFNWSRALLLHFVLHWPQAADENLWPFAVDYAVFIWNNLPSKDINTAVGRRCFENDFKNNTEFKMYNYKII